ncbi:DUF6438 domain-containing protein [Brevundimonas fluminis]|jgi:hypothetical protein|uniref:DUF6438 domain-containing protein n=1 Tax=Brevundimonas fluminis TaxID=2487274 RepID=UPI000F65646E|nr:DUF6438 domain-containing protein [Brevundimonas fluminis]
MRREIDQVVKHLLIVAVLTGLASCATVGDELAAEPGHDVIRVSVGPCYGPCPIYDLVIASNGVARFRARTFQRAGRVQTRVVGVERYEAVATALAAYRPPNTLPPCGEGWTDAQEYTITWTDRSGETVQLDHYSGDGCPESEALTDVLLTIPTVAGVADLVRKPA